MSYDLSQPTFNNAPQWPKFHLTSMKVPHFAATGSAMSNVVRRAMPDGRVQRFAAFPILIDRVGEPWMGIVAWDEGEMA
jgi:hypothetical protein